MTVTILIRVSPKVLIRNTNKSSRRISQRRPISIEQEKKKKRTYIFSVGGKIEEKNAIYVKIIRVMQSI